MKIDPYLSFEGMGIYFPGVSVDGWLSRAARSKVPGGWIVVILGKDDSEKVGVFVPDPNHEWDGNSLP